LAEREGRLSPGVTKIYLRVPVDRLGPLIGEKGKVLKELEDRTGTLISVDSENGSVAIEPATPYTSMDKLLKARDFIRAVAAGFSPEKAWRLLEEDQTLIVINLKEVVGDSPNHLSRVKGRVIGEKGKAKRNIEQMTGVYLNIYDDIIAIIGDYESAQVAREAVEMLIQGRMHSTVYRHIDRLMREIKRRRMREYWSKNMFKP
jgi:ribosomal RNA assembly protein